MDVRVKSASSAEHNSTAARHRVAALSVAKVVRADSAAFKLRGAMDRIELQVPTCTRSERSLDFVIYCIVFRPGSSFTHLGGQEKMVWVRLHLP